VSRLGGPVPAGQPGCPLERRRATVMVVGLLGFATGFAVAGMLVLSNQSRHPLWFIAIGFGLASIGVVGVALSKGTVPMPSTPIWSPPTLRLVARSAGAPVTGFLVAFYLLLGFGLLGNLVLPLFFGGR
jgi:hypothetical protein